MRHAIVTTRACTVFAALALLVVGCGSDAGPHSPPLPGRPVHSASFVARGDVPYRVGAYELTFAEDRSSDARARRAALLVDMAADQGQVRGFVEWGAPGQVPATYLA